MEETRKCPHCGNEIMAAAKKCKHCGKWLNEINESTPNDPIKPNKINQTKQESHNGSSKKILFAILGVIALIFIVVALSRSSNKDSSIDEPISISSLLDKLSRAHSMSDKYSVIRRVDSDDINLEGIGHDVWDTWGKGDDCRISTHNKAIYDELCTVMKGSDFKFIMENDSIFVYENHYNIFIVRKESKEGKYSIDLINDDSDMFKHTMQDRADAQYLKEKTNNLSYDEFTIGRSRGNIKLIYLPKRGYGNKRQLYFITASDTVPKQFYPPSGKDWEIVDYFWGERVSKIIYRNPNADKSRQMEFWAYDNVDDEWDNKLEAPCLSIKRDNTESVPKLTFTWRTASGKNVSLTDYTYQSEYKIPKEEVPEINLTFKLFDDLCKKSADNIMSYFRQKGCTFNDLGGYYSAKVSGGWILVYPKKYSKPRLGVGPLVFSTDNSRICESWRKGLDNAGYADFRNSDIWTKERNVYGCPTFGIADYLDVSEDEGYDYAGASYLYVGEYYEE